KMMITMFDIVLNFFGFILNTFFREIKSRGSHNIPKEGPVIFIGAPHANAFVDGLLLMKYSKRQVFLMIAQNAINYGHYVDILARAIRAIILKRPKDLAESGKGKIFLDESKADSLRINGINTEFTNQLKVGYQISLPREYGSSEITEIISDTELVIKKEFKEPKALEVLTQPGGTPYTCMPYVDQSNLYETVLEMLNAGKCIGVFPEGRSHDRSELIPLKGYYSISKLRLFKLLMHFIDRYLLLLVGIAFMALGAMAANLGLDIKIVPCGLNYFQAHKFRSRAVIEFGSPISIPSELVEKYNMNGSDRREACNKLMEIIYERLKLIAVIAPDYETLSVIRAVRRLCRPENRKLEIDEMIDLDRRLINGYMKFKNDSNVQGIYKKVKEYDQLLKYNRLKDYQVHKTTTSTLTAALKGSYIMISGRHVIATWKILVSFKVIPISYGIYTLISLSLAYKYNWGFIMNFGLFSPIIILIMLFMNSYVTIRLFDIGTDLYRSLYSLILTLSQSTIKDLRKIRNELSYEIIEIINEIGPKIYPDFDNECIIQQLKEIKSK
ncbi:11111_t:CDS:2, partial [Dentiscutata erythropus]